MGYLHIDNLYKNQSVLKHDECYALEKIHGTSAHIKWSNEQVTYFSGGESHERFKALFDEAALVEGFKRLEVNEMTVYGEAYGGKQQGMSKTYGTELKFIVFDVRARDVWYVVPAAELVAKSLGLEFVHYVRVPCQVPMLDVERDRPSTQAVRNGITEPRPSEGIVIRPLDEGVDNWGERLIAKHKRAEFKETATQREVDPDKLKVLEDASAIANEWVTEMRLSHVLDKLQLPSLEMCHTGAVIKAMTEDVIREATEEIVDTKEARQAIGKVASQLYKKRVAMVAQES